MRNCIDIAPKMSANQCCRGGGGKNNNTGCRERDGEFLLLILYSCKYVNLTRGGGANACL